MRLVALALAVAALGLPAARASPASLPGLVYTAGYGNSILMRFDPVTLERTGPSVRLGGPASSWSYSPQRRFLVVASWPQTLTVVNVETMRALGRIRLAPGGGLVKAVFWVRPDRVLAVRDTPAGALVVAVDPLARRIVRRTQLARPFGHGLGRLPDGVAFLLDSRRGLAPVQVAVVDAEGRVRIATVNRAVIGSAERGSGAAIVLERQTPGFAVDPVGRRAYVVDAAIRIAQIDLETLAVTYRGGLRSLAKKSIGGSFRSAQWLGGGLIAVSGADYASPPGAGAGPKPVGLRLVDVRAWTTRTLEPTAASFRVAGNLLLVEGSESRYALRATAYGLDGRERYRLDLAGSTWMKKQGRLGYACRDALLRSVVDLTTGTVLRSGFTPSTRCPTLLAGDSRS